LASFLVLRAPLTLTLARTLPTANCLITGRAVNWSTIGVGALAQPDAAEAARTVAEVTA
jgi:hypothetical protein